MSDSVLISALKMAEEQPAAGARIIVRLYETQGLRAEACIRSARLLRGAEETNLIEDRVGDLDLSGEHELHLTFEPYQIRTICLHC